MTWHDPRLMEHQKSLQVVLDPIIFQIKDGERVAVLLLDVEGAFATEKDEFAAGLFDHPYTDESRCVQSSKYNVLEMN